LKGISKKAHPNPNRLDAVLSQDYSRLHPPIWITYLDEKYSIGHLFDLTIKKNKKI